jgi:hypothetical protein
MRPSSRRASERSDRTLRPTHLIRPYAMPAIAKASAPYLKFTATRNGLTGNEIRRLSTGPARTRFGARSLSWLDASAGVPVMPGPRYAGRCLETVIFIPNFQGPATAVALRRCRWSA